MLHIKLASWFTAAETAATAATAEIIEANTHKTKV